MKKDSIISGATVVVGITVVYRILGFVREAITAAFLGNTAASDAYYVAYSIPYIVVNTIALGAIASAAVPLMVPYAQREDRAGLYRLVNGVFILLVPTLILICAVLVLLCSPITHVLAPGFDAQRHQLAVELSRSMMPFIIPLGISAVFSAASLSHKNFSATPLANLIFNAFMVFGSVAALVAQNLYLLPVSVLIAAAAQLLTSFWIVRRQCGYRLRTFSWEAPKVNPDVKALAGAMLPICLSVMLNMANQTIGRAVASGLDVGSIASLNYAEKVYQLPLGIIVGAVAAVILPYLSQYVHENDENRIRAVYGQCLGMLWMVMIPIIFVMIFFAGPIVSILFERGSFSAADTLRTANTMRIYALALPGAMTIEVNNRMMYAYQDTKKPMIIAAMTVGLNVVLAIMFSRYFKQDGIAIAFAISMTAGGITGFFTLRSKHLFLQKLGCISKMLRFCAVGILTTLPLVFLGDLVSNAVLQAPFIQKFGFIVAIALAVGIIYSALLDALGVLQLRKFILKFLKKQRKD